MKLKDFDFRVWFKKGRNYINRDNLIGFKFSEIDFEFSKNREIEFLLFYIKYTRIDTTGGIEYTAINPTLYNESDDLEIELFTGFYDRAGKKVYEGDILGYDDRGKYAVCSVFYNKDKAMFVAIIHDDKEDFHYEMPMEKFIQVTTHKGFSVVANIHQNLHLLEPIKKYIK